MYASGTWNGYWEQATHGRQEMQAFQMRFTAGTISGRGVDIIGPFTMHGEYHTNDGRVTLVKKYLGKHTVEYTGEPDGEGCIYGTWSVAAEFGGTRYEDRGPFRMRPVLPRPIGTEEIVSIRPNRPKQN